MIGATGSRELSDCPARISPMLPKRRTALKVLHWSMVPLLIWFLLVTPDDVLPFGPRAFQAHSMLALIFVTMCLLWTADYLRRGPVSYTHLTLPTILLV